MCREVLAKPRFMASEEMSEEEVYDGVMTAAVNVLSRLQNAILWNLIERQNFDTDDLSSTVVHLVPQAGGVMGLYVREYASRTMLLLAIFQVNDSQQSNMLQSLRKEFHQKRGAEKGIVWEKFSHAHFTRSLVSTMQYTCKALNAAAVTRSGSAEFELNLQILPIKPFKNLSQIRSGRTWMGDFSSAHYWVPVDRNFETIDSLWCDGYAAVMFQAAIDKAHGIKAQGLLEVMISVPQAVRLYFVVPDLAEFKSFREQTVKNNLTESYTQVQQLQRLEQYVLFVPLTVV